MHAFAPRMTAKPASPSASGVVASRPATPAASVQARLDATLNGSPRVASTRQLGRALNEGPRSLVQARLAQLVRRPARPQRAASFSAPDAAAVQRVVQVNPEVVRRNQNVAVSWKGRPTYAATYTVINDKPIPPSSNKAGLIRRPGFDFLDNVGPPQTRFQLQLTVPTQVVTPLLELATPLPASGDWELADNTVGEIDEYLAAHGGKRPVRPEPDKDQPCTLVVVPDGDLEAKIESHERHHLQDNLKAVQDILVPWDSALQNSKLAADALVGRGPLELLKDYDAIGPTQTAQEIADLLVGRIGDLGEAYHETEEGQRPVITGVGLDKGQNPWKYTVRLKLEKT